MPPRKQTSTLKLPPARAGGSFFAARMASIAERLFFFPGAPHDDYGLNEPPSSQAKSIPAQSAVNGATVTNPKEPITVWSISAATYL